jgi:Oxidoreductase molybdopterin binding domain
MECAGSTRAAHFAMIRVGEWAGIPLSEILLEAKPKTSAAHVLISGFDRSSKLRYLDSRRKLDFQTGRSSEIERFPGNAARFQTAFKRSRRSGPPGCARLVGLLLYQGAAVACETSGFRLLCSFS